MPTQPMSDAEAADIRHQLLELHSEHRDLDQVRRLKKRKLLLKDRILHLEQLLVPDIPA